MAVPTITHVTPSRGHTGGSGLVELTGTGFRLWTIPTPNGSRSGPLLPTVDVLFGGEPGTGVAVVSSTRLFVRPPMSPLGAAKPNYGEGSVDVLVRNVDLDGVPIPSESAVLTGGYTYARPQLSLESDLGRVVREVVRLFRTQVLANVSATTHSDWDRDVADAENIVDVAQLPAIVIFGPRLVPNRFFTQNGLIATRVGNEFVVRPAPETDDVGFTLAGISDNKVEVINLQAAVRKLFAKNRWLKVLRDPTRPELGHVRFDLELDPAGISPDPATDQKSNLRSFSGSFVVRGVDHEDLTGFVEDDVTGRGAIVTETPTLIVTGKGD